MKIAIIGLGLIGNSIGMGLRRVASARKGQAPALQVTGFDPDRAREEAALRRYASVDEVAPTLEQAVHSAQIVILAVPPSAMREVLATLNPLLDEGTTVTDTLSFKEQVMSWAGELLGPHVSFVGGTPSSRSIDLEAADYDAPPTPDLFADAPYAIMPQPGASNESLAHVIWLAEALGARPLFIDPREHDSFLAAVGQLPVVASAALWQMAFSSPTWADMKGVARHQFRRLMEVLAADPATLGHSLAGNRQSLIRWLDRYILALQEMRDLLSDGDDGELLSWLDEVHTSHAEWAARSAQGSQPTDQMHAQLQQAIEEARPGRALIGGYLADRIFGRKDRGGGRTGSGDSPDKKDRH